MSCTVDAVAKECGAGMQDTSNDGIVILVDDDYAVRNSLKFALELEGFSVQTFASPAQLLASAGLPRNGCCLVLDYKLPGMDGLQLLKSLRQKNVKLPAILITSNPSARLRQQAEDEKVQLVEKPILDDCLLQSIHSALTENGLSCG